MPPKYSGNAGSATPKRPQDDSSSRSSKKEPSRGSTAESPVGHTSRRSAGVGKKRDSRDEGQTAHRTGGRPELRSDSRQESRSGTRNSSQPSRPDQRDYRSDGSQRRPSQRPAEGNAPVLRNQPAPEPKNQDGVRLNKAIAATGHCSRRKADELILAGRVTVAGQPEVNPARHVAVIAVKKGVGYEAARFKTGRELPHRIRMRRGQIGVRARMDSKRAVTQPIEC